VIKSVLTKLMGKTTPLPRPFLGPIFHKEVEPVIATGYNYTENEISIHRVGLHRAIDFDVPRSTEIINPCDGWFVATYSEVALTDPDGKPKLLSVSKAIDQNPEGADIHSPAKSGSWPIYFGGYVVQGWHGNGRYTQYMHIDWSNPKIPYYPPIKKDNGDLAYDPILRSSVSNYRNTGQAVFLKAGEVIGRVGMTGCGWDQRCYESANFGKSDRPDFSQSDYNYYTNPHLHFMVFGRRVPRSRNTSVVWDPFGVYGMAPGNYPGHKSQWHTQTNGLWLSQS